jgi:hypothetical protein
MLLGSHKDGTYVCDKWDSTLYTKKKDYGYEVIENEVYAYYDEPILFLCKDQQHKKYLGALAKDTTELKTWFYAPVSEERAAEISNGKIDLYTAFRNVECGAIIVVENGRMFWKNIEDIHDDELPEPDITSKKRPISREQALNIVKDIAENAEKERVKANINDPDCWKPCDECEKKDKKIERQKKLINELRYLLINASRLFSANKLDDNDHVKLWRANTLANEVIKNGQAELELFCGVREHKIE